MRILILKGIRNSYLALVRNGHRAGAWASRPRRLTASLSRNPPIPDLDGGHRYVGCRLGEGVDSLPRSKVRGLLYLETCPPGLYWRSVYNGRGNADLWKFHPMPASGVVLGHNT
jgi:hypothetical protein